MPQLNVNGLTSVGLSWMLKEDVFVTITIKLISFRLFNATHVKVNIFFFFKSTIKSLNKPTTNKNNLFTHDDFISFLCFGSFPDFKTSSRRLVCFLFFDTDVCVLCVLFFSNHSIENYNFKAFSSFWVFFFGKGISNHRNVQICAK